MLLPTVYTEFDDEEETKPYVFPDVDLEDVDKKIMQRSLDCSLDYCPRSKVRAALPDVNEYLSRIARPSELRPKSRSRGSAA